MERVSEWNGQCARTRFPSLIDARYAAAREDQPRGTRQIQSCRSNSAGSILRVRLAGT